MSTEPIMSAQQQPSPQAALPHVLAVDDDPMIRELMVDYLGQNGFRVTAVADGQAMQAVLADGSGRSRSSSISSCRREDGMAIARRHARRIDDPDHHADGPARTRRTG